MATVKFSDLGEFLAELRLEAASIERALIRATYRYKRDTHLPMQSIALIATFIASGHIVTLSAPCGSYFPETREAEDVLAKARGKLATLQAVASELGLEVRHGVYEEGS